MRINPETGRIIEVHEHVNNIHCDLSQCRNAEQQNAVRAFAKESSSNIVRHVRWAGSCIVYGDVRGRWYTV